MRTRMRGFTVVEMTMAIAITSIIALAVVGAGMALSSAYAHSQDYSQSIQTGRVASLKIQSTLRMAKLITAAGGHGDYKLVAWAKDPNGDSKINVSELAMLTCDPNAQVIVEHTVVFPTPALATLLDSTVLLETAMDVTAVQTMMEVTYGAYHRKEVLADRVISADISVDQPPPMTRMVKFQLGVGDSNRSITLYAGGTLRADMTSHVGMSGGKYVLNTTTVP